MASDDKDREFRIRPPRRRRSVPDEARAWSGAFGQMMHYARMSSPCVQIFELFESLAENDWACFEKLALAGPPTPILRSCYLTSAAADVVHIVVMQGSDLAGNG